MTVPDDEQSWCIREGIAWVPGEGRVALIETAVPDAEPLIISGPVASLWQALGDGPLSTGQLTSVAESLVEADPEGFVVASLAVLSEATLITPEVK